MPILVSHYDPTWPDAFSAIARPLWGAVSDLALTIEHVGSTSVPGLSAKPIIDLDIILPSHAQLAPAIARLEALGHRHRGDLGIVGREAFTRRPDLPAHNLYLGVYGAPAIGNHLAVRDHLRRHPTQARAYGALKHQLAAQFPDDIDAYVDGKTAFLLDILQRTGFAQDDLDAIERANRLP